MEDRFVGIPLNLVLEMMFVGFDEFLVWEREVCGIRLNFSVFGKRKSAGIRLIFNLNTKSAWIRLSFNYGRGGCEDSIEV